MTTECPPVAVSAMGESSAATVAATLKALSDPLRIRMLSAISTDPRGEACVCDLEALAHLRVDRVPVPTQQPGEEDDVGGAGDRQQLGGALHDAQRDRATDRQSPFAQASGGVVAGSVGSRVSRL